MEHTKLGLGLLCKALNAAPIPDPFKCAVTAIPNIAFQILEIVEAVKDNVKDAEALAVYIATVINTTMRPFETKALEELDRSPDMKKRLEEFQGALEKVKEEMRNLMSRRMHSRILGYVSDAGNLAAMKQSVDDAMNQLQLETTMAVGHDVNMIRHDQRIMIEDQRLRFRMQEEHDRVAAQQQAQQQLFTTRQQYMPSQERLDAGSYFLSLVRHLWLIRVRELEINLLINLLGKEDTGAAKKSPCLAGTREHVLERIKARIDDVSGCSKHCYLLLGQAGTGKSAIARSIADRESELQRLGAVFHFTRDEQARNKSAILVLARQLACWAGRRLRLKIASAIESALQDELDIVRMTPENQFQRLVQEPLETLDDTSPALVIILDALDECDDAYADGLLRLFGKLLGKLPNQVKLFITSRAEPHLQRCYHSDPLGSHLESHCLGSDKIELVHEDIRVYFKERLPDMVGHWVAKPLDWPGEENLRALVHKTQGLFICATTVVGMLADPNFRDPETQLKGILSSNHTINLDEIYKQILTRACPVSSNGDLVTLFRSVLGALVVARVPMNIHTLVSLISPDGSQNPDFACRIQRTVLSYLQAVLVVPDVRASEVSQDAQPIRFIHSSFVDYLTDKSRCEPRFFLDLAEEHEHLAIGCFRRMDDLRRNICDLKPSLLNAEVKNLEQRIEKNMSPGLQYACIQISVHVAQTPIGSASVRALLDQFAQERLMSWLEGLSLMGIAHEAVEMTSLMECWLKAGLHLFPTPPELYTVPSGHSLNGSLLGRAISPPSVYSLPGPTTLRKRDRMRLLLEKLIHHAPSPSSIASGESEECTIEIFHDLRRFVMEFMEPIASSSLHIYSSALPFTPSRTALSRRYGHLAQGGPTVIRGRAERWSQTLWTASRHASNVSCVAVTPDNTTIVSGSYDQTLRLWDAKTGAAIGKAMEGHTCSVSSIVITSDSSTVISGSFDHTLRLWDAKTGAPIAEMEGHTRPVNCIALSPDNKTIVSGSNDDTLRLWDARTGEAIGQTMKGHTGAVNCVAITLDGTTVVSGSYDKTLRLWDIKTGAAIGKVMKGHTDSVSCVAVCPHSATIVSGSYDGTVRRWDAKSGAAIGKAMKGHTDPVSCITVSTHSPTIVSGSKDKTLHLWDARSGAAIGKALVGHTDAVQSVTVSPDGKTIVSVSKDKTLRLWDSRTGAAVGKAMEGHTGSVDCVTVSPDSTTIVSGSYDKTLRVWDAVTKAATAKATKGHGDLVGCVAVYPSCTTIASGSYDNTLRLWDVTTGAAIGEAMEGHTSSVSCIAVSPDNTTIVSGSHDNTLRLWDARTRVGIGKAMEGHTLYVSCVAISPDSTTIVSGSHDHTLRLWHTRNGAAIGEVMQGHTGSVSCVAFSDDGKWIISVSGVASETFVWNRITQTRLPAAAAQRAIPGLKTLGLPFKLDGDGWVLDSRGWRLFWLPVDLRGEVMGRSNIISVANRKVPILDISAYVL